MGNRAVITDGRDADSIGIYLHWNGGRDSVEGFLKYCELRGFASIDRSDYGVARMTQVIANFYGGDGTSIGVGKLCQLDCDNMDNGTYIVKGFEIVDRMYFDGEEQAVYPLVDVVKAVDQAQPEAQQLGQAMINDLLYHGKRISDVDSMYHYYIKKHIESGKCGIRFEVGQSYRDITILEVKEHTAHVEYAGKVGEVPLFHWRDGTESLLVPGDMGRDIQVSSVR